ncbi:MAG: dethiobiotin synthase [Rickettsiaceae bacterium]|nr:MAG: dethiobiotin synthase [Rickettsiaceae bacterium]
MKIFLTGTDTDIGKTLVASWICLHSKYSYFKPIQTGSDNSLTDKEIVENLSDTKIYNETYIFKDPYSPHKAAKLENTSINIENIKLPTDNNIIIEGAGGILVPINDRYLMIDLIIYLNLPVIVVARPGLGTINHTCLTLEVLKLRRIKILGVIINGGIDQDNKEAIMHYGNTQILAELPKFGQVTKQILSNFSLPINLKNIL